MISIDALVLLRTIAALLVGAGLFLAYRTIARQSRVLGYIVAFGILIRAGSGLALFWISYLDLPLLRRLQHTGDGFWSLAPDARAYFLSAASAAENGIHTISLGSASPAYVKTLALWMMAVGISPGSSILFNLVCYVLTCGLLLFLFRSLANISGHAASVFTIGAITGSPALIAFGTQPLKDTFFSFLVVVASVGVFWIAASLRVVTWRGLLGVALTGWMALLPAVYLLAGIRTYFAFLVWCALWALFGAAIVVHGLKRIPRVLPVMTATVAAVLIAFALGAGPYADEYTSMLPIIGGENGGLLRSPASARSGFINSGGGTNIGSGEELRSLGPRPLGEHASILAVGMSTLFVPITLLRSLSIIDFDGGRGMLLLTDIDTLFLDATLLISLAFIAFGWTTIRRNVVYAAFTLSLTLVLTGLMAYVVTNYGTLVRLRLMVAVLIWIVPLAMLRGRDRTDEPVLEPHTARAAGPIGGVFAAKTYATGALTERHETSAGR